MKTVTKERERERKQMLCKQIMKLNFWKMLLANVNVVFVITRHRHLRLSDVNSFKNCIMEYNFYLLFNKYTIM